MASLLSRAGYKRTDIRTCASRRAPATHPTRTPRGAQWSPVRLGSRAVSDGVIVSPPARLSSTGSAFSRPFQRASSHIGMRELSITYMTRNQQPKVSLISPAGGESWSKSQTIRWNGSDPDNDTLSYEVYLSGDGGLTWKKLPSGSDAGAQPPSAGATAGPPVKPSRNSRKRCRIICARYHGRHAPRGVNQRQSGDRRPAATSKQWDTKSSLTGYTGSKVIASDRPSNPTDYLTAEAISDPFIVTNASPCNRIGARRRSGRGWNVHGSGYCGPIPRPSHRRTVSRGRRRLDCSCSAAGLFDSSRESFTFTTSPLPKGSHNIEVAAFNSAGGKSVEKSDRERTVARPAAARPRRVPPLNSGDVRRWGSPAPPPPLAAYRRGRTRFSCAPCASSRPFLPCPTSLHASLSLRPPRRPLKKCGIPLLMKPILTITTLCAVLSTTAAGFEPGRRCRPPVTQSSLSAIGPAGS